MSDINKAQPEIDDEKPRVLATEFINFVTSGNKPSLWPTGLEFSGIELDQMRSRLDKGLDDQVISNLYERFEAASQSRESTDLQQEADQIALDLSQDLELDALDIEQAMDVIEDFDQAIEALPNETVDLLAGFRGMDESEEVDQELQTIIDEDLDSLNDEGWIPETSLPEDSVFETVEDPEILTEEDHDDNNQDQDQDQDQNQRNNQREYIEQQQSMGMAPMAGGGQGAVANNQRGAIGQNLYRMTAALTSGVADLSEIATGSIPAAKVSLQAAWGTAKDKLEARKAQKQADAVNASVEKASTLTPEQGANKQRNYRERNLSGQISNMSDIMKQAEQSMDRINQPIFDGADISVANALSAVKESDDPMMARVLKHQLEEYIKDKGMDALLQEAQDVAYANDLLSGYAENSIETAHKLGMSVEEIEASIKAPLNDYLSDMASHSEMLAELNDIAGEVASDPEMQEKTQQMKELIDNIQEVIKSMLDKLKEKLGISQGSDPSPQP